jgi:hypothetical protein
MNEPLVSIVVPNYNYGHYLRQCLDSLFNQTYRNIEVVFSDNASTDDSFTIAQSYLGHCGDRLVLARQRKNLGPGPNDATAVLYSKGQYLIHFGSDDVMMPDFVQRSMELFGKHPDLGYVIGHTDAIDEAGNLTREAPFYNTSCIIPGVAQAAVLMMAGVTTHTSQTVYRRGYHDYAIHYSPITSTLQGERTTNFQCACHFDVGYIKDTMLLCRESKQSDGYRLDRTMLQIFGQFMMLHNFDELASQLDMQGIRDRMPQAIEKLGSLCLRYAGIMLKDGEEATALKYLHMAPALQPGIEQDELYLTLWDCLKASGSARKVALEAFEARNKGGFLRRNVSYDPPSGSFCLDSTTCLS